MDYNHCSIVGRLAGKPMLKGYNKSDGTEGFRCFMRVAVTRIGDLGRQREERRTNFIPVVCWGELAKRVAQYLDKGTEVTCGGEFIAESTPKLDGNGAQIVINGVKQYNEYVHLQAGTVQFGRRSNKNATPDQLIAEAKALQTRIDAAAAGAGQPTGTDAGATPTPAAGGTNPFGETGAQA